MNLVYVIIGAFLLVGIIISIQGVRAIIRASKIKTFEELEATVISLSDRQNTYTPQEAPKNIGNFKLDYQYTFRGQTYKSNNIGFVENKIQSTNNVSKTNEISTIYINDTTAFIDSLIQNNKLKVWINPKRPEESIIYFKKSSVYTYLTFGLVSILFSLMFIIVLSIGNYYAFTESIQILKQKP